MLIKFLLFLSKFLMGFFLVRLKKDRDYLTMKTSGGQRIIDKHSIALDLRVWFKLWPAHELDSHYT